MIEVETNHSFEIINYLVRLIGLRNIFQIDKFSNYRMLNQDHFDFTDFVQLQI